MDENNRTAYAFPIGTADQVFEPGMTMRDYFAAKAMQARMTAFCSLETFHNWSNAEIAADAYELADAMLKAREA